MGKTKVAVLGGGVGGIVAAMQLTATKELRDEFEVTVHQLGWRLGGKGASGRNPDRAWRIEEHGLHIWFGFYDNAFRVMREAYDELGRDAKAPLATLEDAFKPLGGIALYDRQDDGWWSFAAPGMTNAGRPGDGHGMPGFWDVNVQAFEFLAAWWKDLVADNPVLGGTTVSLPWWVQIFGKAFGAGADAALEAALDLARAQAGGLPDPPPLVGQTVQEAYVGLLRTFRDAVWVVVKPRYKQDPQLRLFFTSLDTVACAMRGIVEDGVLDDPRGLHALDDHDLAAWLKSHGAKTVTVGSDPEHRSPLLRALYDLSFGYPEGDIMQADISAGTAIDDLLRLSIAFRGSMAYKMQAGMGDAVFAPFYEVLVARGVRFEFFSAVQELHLDPKVDRIDRIDVVSQVEVVGGSPYAPPGGGYAPLVDVKGLPCWPSVPDWDQLDGGAKLKGKVDFEASVNPLQRPVTTLKRGVDFDEVVLGISLGALPPLTKDLVARVPRFAKALKTGRTVWTQAFQVWLNEDTKSVGYPHGKATVAGCFVEPLDTYADMSHLIDREAWTATDGVRSIAYFCGVMPHDPAETQAQATARARTLAVAFLEDDSGGLWPNAMVAGALPGMRWELVCDDGPSLDAARFDSQYWRANMAGSELYVLSTSGTIKHRLRSGDTGVANMAAAGDWTNNGINGGCVEAAAVSGIDAARSIIKRHILAPQHIPPPPTNAKPTWLGDT